MYIYAAVILCLCACFSAGLSNNILSHYEMLDHRDIIHRLHKRSIDDSYRQFERRVSLDVLGKHLELHLLSNPALFDEEFEAVLVDSQGHKQAVEIDTTEFYHGYVEDDEYSRVSAYWEDDNLVARIQLKDDTIVVEPSSWTMPASTNHTMIAYHAKDVKGLHNPTNSFCGYVHPDHDDAAYDVLQRKGHIELDSPPRPSDQHTTASRPRPTDRHRHKRQSSTNTRCTITLVGDTTFYNEAGRGSEQAAIRYMIGTLQNVNEIFTTTDFNMDGTADNLGMTIKTVIQHTSYTDDLSHYNADKTWGAEELLTAFSTSDWSGSCLAHLFTARPFDGGILGLAWVASAQLNYAGGICSTTTGLDYNTGWSSLLNAGNERLSSEQSDIVTGHEIGHNWGSSHDPDTAECAPSGANGNFIMYTYAVSGDNPNNDMFSPCSIQTIQTVLAAKQASCFVDTDPNAAVCGNFIKEGSEQCDAGGETNPGDACCSVFCRLNRRKDCSDYNSGCCVNCEIAPSSYQCRTAADNRFSCEQDTFCRGDSEECPETSPSQPDGTTCGDEGGCVNGVCASFCGKQDLVDCLCETDADACYYCCLVDDVCQRNSSVILPEGRSCYNGYCDATGVCEKTVTGVDYRDWFIITDFTPNNIAKFMRNNIVLTVVVLSLICYAPFVIIVLCVDYRAKKQLKEEKEFKLSSNASFVRNPGNEDKIQPAFTRRGGSVNNGHT